MAQGHAVLLISSLATLRYTAACLLPSTTEGWSQPGWAASMEEEIHLVLELEQKIRKRVQCVSGVLLPHEIKPNHGAWELFRKVQRHVKFLRDCRFVRLSE